MAPLGAATLEGVGCAVGSVEGEASTRTSSTGGIKGGEAADSVGEQESEEGENDGGETEQDKG